MHIITDPIKDAVEAVRHPVSFVSAVVGDYKAAVAAASAAVVVANEKTDLLDVVPVAKGTLTLAAAAVGAALVGLRAHRESA